MLSRVHVPDQRSLADVRTSLPHRLG
jgi:hypothetical protein